MAKVFEDLFMELQTDMVCACLDYVDDRADKVYVYGSCEGNTIACDYFYEVNGKIVDRVELKDISDDYDVSYKNQGVCLRTLIDDLKDMSSLCKEYNRPKPTEIKLTYDVEKNSLQTHYCYEPQYSWHKTRMSDDVANDWYKALKKEIKKRKL